MEDTVRVTLQLSPAEMQALQRLQQLRGDTTLEETILAGLALHGVTESEGFLQLSDDLWPDADW